MFSNFYEYIYNSKAWVHKLGIKTVIVFLLAFNLRKVLNRAGLL